MPLNNKNKCDVIRSIKFWTLTILILLIISPMSFALEKKPDMSKTRKIAYVEDNIEQAAMIKRWFANDEHCVMFTYSGADTFKQAIDSNDFELIMFDIELGGSESGIDLLHYVKREKNTDISTMIVSASSLYLADAVKGADADHYLAKPLRRNQLITQVHQMLGVALDTQYFRRSA